MLRGFPCPSHHDSVAACQPTGQSTVNRRRGTRACTDHNAATQPIAFAPRLQHGFRQLTTFNEIPLTPINQTFPISLSGVTYTLTFQWRTPVGTWVMDIGDVNGNPLVSGIALVTGADLLAQR